MVHTTETASYMNTCTSQKKVDDDSVVQGFECEIMFLLVHASEVKFVVYRRAK